MSAKVKPENFKEVIIEFTSQLAQTFPEYLPQLAIWYDEQTPDNKYDDFFKHCLGVYPERMMDILYKNEEIFDKSKNPKVNTEFVPQIYFCDLFLLQGITEKTKNAIWKYLQIILFLCLPKVDNNKQFGDMGDVFAMMNDDVLNGKMTEIFTSMFENMPRILVKKNPMMQIHTQKKKNKNHLPLILRRKMLIAMMTAMTKKVEWDLIQ